MGLQIHAVCLFLIVEENICTLMSLRVNLCNSTQLWSHTCYNNIYMITLDG